MFGKNVFKKLKTGTLVAFLSTLAFFTSFSGIDSEATSTYYVRVLLDEGGFGMVSQVISDKTESDKFLERDGGVDFSAISDYKKVHDTEKYDPDTPGSSLIANIVNTEEDANVVYEKLINSSNKNDALVFSFPGLTSAIDSSIKYQALSSDMARAELVSNTLTKGMNDALAFIKTYSTTEHINGEGLRHIIAQLARITSQFGESGGNIGFNTGPNGGKKGFNVRQITKASDKLDGSKVTVGEELIPVNGLRYSDYVAISTRNSQGEIVYGYFPWRMAKGYYSTSKNVDAPLASLVGDTYVKASKEKENEFLTWGQMAIQAGVNADVRGSSSVDSASDSMTLIGQGLGADMTSAIVSIRSMLSLAPIQELILNMGSRASTHHMGVMTQDMFNTAKTVYVLVFCVSLLLLSGIVVNTIHQKMLSTTNIVARVSFMEKLQDLVFVGVMLAIFPSVFELMLELNYWIVKTFSYSSSYLQAYGITGSKVLSTESMAGAMVSTMFLSIDIYINMTYLTRSILLAFLFAISPLVTVLYPLGSMQKKMYIGYFRELVGTIFMQSFHAIVMCFFAGYNTTNMSAMEAIVSTYCFIPVTQLFKTFVVGHTGFTESVGGKLAGQLTNTASGLHKSGVMMKQSQEMMDLQAKNARNLSFANLGAQMTGIATDIAGSALQNNMMNKEIGANLGATATKGASKSGGLSTPGVGTNLKSAVAGAGVSLAGAGLGAIGSGLAEKSNRNNMGEMQMKHSMENIGIGLAQAGMGLGVSSYDAGSGNSMIGAGMNSVQQGAKEYGAGQSNAGAGGSYLGWAKGTDAINYLGGRAISTTASSAMKNHNKLQEEQNRLAESEHQQQLKQESRGLTTSQALSAMGVQNSEKIAPHIEIKPQGSTNNTVFKADVSKLSQVEGNNPHFNYLKELKEKGEHHPDVIKARDIAVKNGLELNFGGNGTGVVGDLSKKDSQVSFVIKNMNQYGLEFDGGGNAFAVTDNTQLNNK